MWRTPLTNQRPLSLQRDHGITNASLRQPTEGCICSPQEHLVSMNAFCAPFSAILQVNYSRPSHTSELGYVLRSNLGGKIPSTIPVPQQQHRDQRLLGVHPDDITHGTHHLDAAALLITTENRTQRLFSFLHVRSQFHDFEKVATPSLWWSVCFVDKGVLFLHPRLGCQHPVRASPLVRFSTGAATRTTLLRLLSAMTIGDPPQAGIDRAFSLATSSCYHLQIPSRHFRQGTGHSSFKVVAIIQGGGALPVKTALPSLFRVCCEVTRYTWPSSLILQPQFAQYPTHLII